ncbi:MAG TPA: nickel pincer cofactor biosynthesis protein LarC [Thermodesulfobacteriota bacterium]|nr:nickel pincer cofactor biosynthesis protein LarC [Thermodesulfobacteriota bacterium]
MAIAYFDCFSGISGDMVVGALVDLGCPLSFLQENLASLPLGACVLTASRQQQASLTGTRFLVDQAHPDKTERTFRDIQQIIAASSLPGIVKEQALQVFHCLAEAEARIHDQPIEDVHFHEIGATDTIVDVTASLLGIHYLDIKRVFSSPLPLGSGFVRCRHGLLPVPAPATLEILKSVPVYAGDSGFELVTPTGAAIAVTLAERFGSMPPLRIKSVGYGVGERVTGEKPNLLRVLLGTSTEAITEETLIVIETALDDLNPEIYQHVMDLLFQHGALDVFLIPVYMKKNRPGTLLRVIAHERDLTVLSSTIFQETSTLGLRYCRVDRLRVHRESEFLETPWGTVRVKISIDPEGKRFVSPEYEDCRRIAREQGIPLKRIYQEIVRRSPD